MIPLLVALLLSGPLPHKDCRKTCLGVCSWSWEDHTCHDTMVVDLGEWYPRPADFEWPANPYMRDPPEFGAFPCEKPVITPL